MTAFQFTSGLVSFPLIHYSSNQVFCTDGPPTFLRLWRSRKSNDPADPELCPKSMTRHQNIRDQANQANEHAIQGGIDGGIRWFLAGVIVFGTAQLVWPPYR